MTDSDATISLLLIEDDEDDYILAQDFLDQSHQAYRLEWVADYREGVELLCANQHELALVDYYLGGRTGLDLVDEAARLGAQIPVIMLTGRADRDVDIQAMSIGVMDYLVKDDINAHLLDRSIRYALNRDRIERQLARERNYATAIVDGVEALVVVMDPEGKIVTFNRAAERTTGYRSDEVIGSRVWDFLAGSEIAAETRARFMDVVELREPVSVEGDWLTRTGEARWIAWRYSVVQSGDGDDVRYVIASGLDLTRQRAQERMLQQTGKLAAIGELAGNVAHEVNNPIGIISAKARLLMDAADMDRDKLDTELGKIAEQCDRISRLTRGLLDFAAPTAVAPEPVDVRAPLQKAADLAEHRIAKHGVTLQMHLPTTPAIVSGNENELQQVFLNLILNAVDAMLEGGTLDVTCTTEARTYDIAIRDTGHGIDPEIRDRIFEPFFTRKRAQASGTGLGLSISLGLIQKHGGDIQITSRPNRGTTVHVLLPEIAAERHP